MSFFLKGKPKLDRKRKPQKERPKQATKKSKTELPSVKGDNDEEDDEEIDSEEEEELENGQSSAAITFSDEEILETPQDRRLKLAKKYLEEIEIEEQNRADDQVNIQNNISQRLTDEYLDSVGKLRRKVADEFTGYNHLHVKKLKHKLHKLPITCMSLSADNEFLFTASKNHFVIKWNLTECKVMGKINCKSAKEPSKGGYQTKTIIKSRPQVLAMALSTDFKFLAIAAMDNYVQIWCPNTLESLHTLQGHRDVVTGLVFRKDSHQLYTTSKDRSVKIWSLDDMTYIESLFGHQSAITDIDALARERAITSGGFDGSIRIWKIVEESQLIYNGHKGTIDLVRLINEENFLSAGSDGSLCIWSGMKKKPLCIEEFAHGRSENGEANWISAIATLLNTDLIASGASDGSVKIWKLGENFRTLQLLFNISVIGFINGLTFANDGNELIVAVGQEHRLGRWWRIKEADNNVLIVPFERNKKS